ncbi:MAG TPA: MBL fold metallo-hydrolase [Thermoanaerobaculia bacterium]|nr:MBL fold metallo-hydrolase [Thermoanaerobaculia bacterium]
MRTVRLVLVSLALLQVFASGTAAANPFEYEWQQLAPGVWAGIRQDPFELPQEGNSVFVITDEGVVVFDAGGSPLMGESIVAKVRSLTERPITHVIISHWHGDHMRGLQAIQAAFPRVAIVSHPFARDFIATTQDKWLKRRVTMVPNIRKALDAALGQGKDLKGRPLIPEERAWLEKGSSITEQLDRENNRTRYVIPNATFTDGMVLYLGGREIQFLHLGNSHTAGDIVMWLPQEKIVATGDVVTAPVPLMPSPYAQDYAGVIEKIKALGFKTLVPGHGPVQHDSAYVDLLVDTFQTVMAQMKSARAKGLSKEQAIASIDLTSVESRFTHGDAFLTNRFHDYVSAALPEAAWLVESGTGIKETF